MGRMGCCIVGKLGKRQPSLPMFLSIMTGDAEVLFECLDGSLTKSISLWVVGSREAWAYVKLPVKFSKAS